MSNAGSAQAPPPDGAADGPSAAPTPREYVRILIIAALLGVLAAAASAAWGLSFFGALLAALLAGSAAAETIPIAVIASVIGWLAATALKKRESHDESRRAPVS